MPVRDGNVQASHDRLLVISMKEQPLEPRTIVAYQMGLRFRARFGTMIEDSRNGAELVTVDGVNFISQKGDKWRV